MPSSVFAARSWSAAAFPWGESHGAEFVRRGGDNPLRRWKAPVLAEARTKAREDCRGRLPCHLLVEDGLGEGLKRVLQAIGSQAQGADARDETSEHPILALEAGEGGGLVEG